MTLNDWAHLTFQFRYHLLRKATHTISPKILDIGCGSTHPYYVRLLFPGSSYTGIDLLPFESLPARTRASIDHYHRCDLAIDGLTGLAGAGFDVIILSHVLEHLLNGLEVLDQACKRLAPNGLLYCEYPRFASTRMPSLSGTLNFWDDPTHVRLYNMMEILNVLNANRIKVDAFGTRRFWPRIAVMPLLVAHSLITERRLKAANLWDFFGFPEYVLGHRPNYSLPKNEPDG